ncbi:hypothetical protein GMORB2_3422 [Geosmithia morbida]|uniref:Uncharacterized protein n=1 Tax=Geosmithia morbida TaxID=1094350 RepID=A0A9P4YQZ7_9HYPO|nr:uncharacterized protein GMORB2_3422 [Geosmithia morbida]KAF4120011.1 hypothetical protein GMORB2_3422 [Geosmithia morbida]
MRLRLSYRPVKHIPPPVLCLLRPARAPSPLPLQTHCWTPSWTSATAPAALTCRNRSRIPPARKLLDEYPRLLDLEGSPAPFLIALVLDLDTPGTTTMLLPACAARTARIAYTACATCTTIIIIPTDPTSSSSWPCHQRRTLMRKRHLHANEALICAFALCPCDPVRRVANPTILPTTPHPRPDRALRVPPPPCLPCLPYLDITGHGRHFTGYSCTRSVTFARNSLPRCTTWPDTVHEYTIVH